MNSKDFKSGDILRATHRDLRKGYHPIIYVSDYSDTDFIGAMLTHHENSALNVKMDSTYFVNKLGFEKTYLVIGKFMKSEEWGPFIKVNQLTPQGLSFVNTTINEKPLETFANYFRRNVK